MDHAFPMHVYDHARSIRTVTERPQVVRRPRALRTQQPTEADDNLPVEQASSPMINQAALTQQAGIILVKYSNVSYRWMFEILAFIGYF